MNYRRTGLVALVSAALLVAVEPAAAQSINSELITNLNERLLYVAIPITLLVEVILIYTVYRFRDNDDPTPTRENRRLEITWTVATAIILLFVGLAAFTVLGNPYISLTEGTTGDIASAQEVNASDAGASEPSIAEEDLSGAVAPPTGSDAVEIDMLAYQWGWTFTYPEQGFNTSQQMVVPTNRTVFLHVRSRSVLHAVHVPALGLKQDAFPGSYNTIATNVTEPGTYQLYCAQYCGAGHSSMQANVTAMNGSAYQDWIAQQSGGGSGNASASGNSSSGNTTGGSNGTTSASIAGGQRIAAPAAPSSAAA